MKVVFSGSRLLFTPAQPSPTGTDALYELRRAAGEPLTALVFTTLDRLVDGCGPDQPWVAVPADTLLTQLEQAAVDRVVVDGVLAPGARWTPDTAPPAAAAQVLT